MPVDDDDERDAPSIRPLLPPEDRIWRHPSELGQAALGDAAGAGGPAALAGWASPMRSRPWAVAAVMSMVGVTIAVGTVAVFTGLDARVADFSTDSALLKAGVAPVSVVVAPAAPADIASAVAPAIAALQVHGNPAGSAVLFREDGYLITSASLVAKAKDITIILADGRQFDAVVVGSDPETDIAVVRISGSDVPTADLGTIAGLEVGATCIAVGSAEPGGDPAVIVAVVRGLGRHVERGDADALNDMIETDGAMAENSSGGALVDDSGRVVGITTSVESSEGADADAFATPIDVAQKVASDIITTGQARHPWLGVEGADVVGEHAEKLGVAGGAILQRVVEGSPAAAARLSADDVIVAVDDQTVLSMSALVVALRTHRPGDEVVITILRDGRRHTVRVRLAERPPAAN